MFNAQPEPERHHIVDVTALNGFLTKMYSIMGLAVLVSALTAYLATTVFAKSYLNLVAGRPAVLWILMFVPVGLCLGISFQATRKPTTSFFLLMLMAVVYGLTLAPIAYVYTGAQIGGAFVCAAAVFVGMALYGSVTKKNLDNFGAYASAALWGLIVASLVNVFLRSSAATFVFSIIGVVIFTALTAYDAQKMKQIYLEYGSQVPELGLAVNGALTLYLDFLNLFIELLQIFGMLSDDR